MEKKSQDLSHLLASLNELSDWTDRKEKELEEMAPLGGDEATLRQQQVSQGTIQFYIKIYN